MPVLRVPHCLPLQLQFCQVHTAIVDRTRGRESTFIFHFQQIFRLQVPPDLWSNTRTMTLIDAIAGLVAAREAFKQAGEKSLALSCQELIDEAAELRRKNINKKEESND